MPLPPLLRKVRRPSKLSSNLNVNSMLKGLIKHALQKLFNVGSYLDEQGALNFMRYSVSI